MSTGAGGAEGTRPDCVSLRGETRSLDGTLSHLTQYSHRRARRVFPTRTRRLALAVFALLLQPSDIMTSSQVAGLLNAQFNAWDGSGLPPRGITQAGLLVRATTSPHPPGKKGALLTNHTQWRKWAIARNAMHAVRTRADGLSPDETPVALTLLNRGLARLIGRNEVAFDRWSWGLPSTSVPCQSQNGGCTPGLIMLAVGELADDRVLYGYARDGSSNSRERGCGCMQTTERTESRGHQTPALLFGVPRAEKAVRVNSSHSRRERAFSRREQWARCQPGGHFRCDALPYADRSGLHASALDGSCVFHDVPLTSAPPTDRSTCGSSMCAWRPAQARQMLAAQAAIVRATRAGRFEALTLHRGAELGLPGLGLRDAPTLYNEVVTTCAQRETRLPTAPIRRLTVRFSLQVPRHACFDQCGARSGPGERAGERQEGALRSQSAELCAGADHPSTLSAAHAQAQGRRRRAGRNVRRPARALE